MNHIVLSVLVGQVSDGTVPSGLVININAMCIVSVLS